MTTSTSGFVLLEENIKDVIEAGLVASMNYGVDTLTSIKNAQLKDFIGENPMELSLQQFAILIVWRYFNLIQ